MNTNSQHDINGWTALHWAAKRNHLNIVNLLCNHGADKNVQTNKGEVAAQLTSEGVIKVSFLDYWSFIMFLQVLLNAQASKLAPLPAAKEAAKKPDLPITPNYIKNPPVAYQVDLSDKAPAAAVAEKKPRLEPAPLVQQRVVSSVSGAVRQQELVLKVGG